VSSERDIVLTVAGGYSWSAVKAWAASLVQCGFEGKKLVILYEHPDKAANAEIRSNLLDKGFIVIDQPYRGAIYVQRFFDIASVLASHGADTRYAILTDVRDVYFQHDPARWLEANLTKPLYASSESVQYRHAPWNRQSALDCFPELADRLMDKTVRNAGVIAGSTEAVCDLCLAIGLIARSTKLANGDQSSYNLLLGMYPFNTVTQFGVSEDGFACQAGTTADPAKVAELRPHLQAPLPYMDADGVKTASGRLYSIVHQYDRVPAWSAAIAARVEQLSF
jgi:hypothetical protein